MSPETDSCEWCGYEFQYDVSGLREFSFFDVGEYEFCCRDCFEMYYSPIPRFRWD